MRYKTRAMTAIPVEVATEIMHLTRVSTRANVEIVQVDREMDALQARFARDVHLLQERARNAEQQAKEADARLREILGMTGKAKPRAFPSPIPGMSVEDFIEQSQRVGAVVMDASQLKVVPEDQS